MEQVRWHEAAAYCNALSVRARHTPCYTCSGSGRSVTCAEHPDYQGQDVYACSGYRLPTDAEWEYACRAGTQDAYYSGPNAPYACDCNGASDPGLDPIAWYCANSGSTPHPVATKRANAWNLHDMAGNVREWCHDWWQRELGSSAVTNPVGTGTSSAFRAIRGGSWTHNARHTRSANRASNSVLFRYYNLGFRCARGLLP